MSIENNKLISELKLIAVFDGWELSIYPNLPDKVYKYNEEIGIPVNQLNYHEDLNLLMPLVKKCEQADNIISPNRSNFHVDIDMFLKNDIAKIYKAVVEFITWYNKQQPKK